MAEDEEPGFSPRDESHCGEVTDDSGRRGAGKGWGRAGQTRAELRAEEAEAGCDASVKPTRAHVRCPAAPKLIAKAAISPDLRSQDSLSSKLDHRFEVNSAMSIVRRLPRGSGDS